MRTPIEYGPGSSDALIEYEPAQSPLASYDEADSYSRPRLLARADLLRFIAPSMPRAANAGTSTEPSGLDANCSVAALGQGPAPTTDHVSASSPQITLYSAKKSRRIDMDIQVSPTVTQASPLRVVADGATVDSLAGSLNGATYAFDARVIVRVRNPQIPLVLGVET